MALIVVGGQAKHVGKTTLVCEIIRHFGNVRWTAAKITSHSHDPEQCVRVASGPGWTMWQQSAGDSRVDTARYLNAGATRSLFLCAESESLARACAALKMELSACGAAIVESTAGAKLLAPDLFLLVVNPASDKIKASASEPLARAHAVVVNTDAEMSTGVEFPNRMLTFSTLKNGIDVRLADMIQELLR